MADKTGQIDIRGLDIQKLVVGFAEEANILKNYVRISPTSAREIRYFSKTSGFLDSVDTTTITASQIANTSDKSRPVVVSQSWTRNTSYVRKYFVTSEMISDEDIKDSDVDCYSVTIRDLVRAGARQVDSRIYTVITTGTGVLTGAATAAWDTVATCNPIKDILVMKAAIRSNGYNPEGAIMYIHPTVHKDLMNYLINVKGSSIPSFSSNLMSPGVVHELLGARVIVSENATDGQVAFFVPNCACWKEFMPITTGVVEEVGVGRAVRIWEEGECILEEPKSSYLLTTA